MQLAASSRARAVLTGEPLGRLLACWLLSSTALWMFIVSAAVFAYHRSGTDGIAAVSVARLLPAVLAAPVAGGLADRLDRGRLVAVSSAVCALAYAAAAAVVLGDGSTAWVVSACALASISGAAIRPALESLLPALSRTPAETVRATALWGAADSCGFLLGAGAGGLLLAAFGSGEVMAVAAGLVVIGTATASSLPTVPATTADETHDEQAGLWAGLRAVRATPLLHAPVVLLIGLLILEGTSDVQLVALAMGPLHLGAAGPGLLYAVWGAGGVLASGVLLLVVRRIGYGRALSAGGLTFAVALGVCGVHGATLAVAAMVPVGLGFALVESAALGVVPRLVDDAVVGRVYGVLEVIYSGAAALGAVLAAPLIGALGVAHSLVAVGAAYALLVAATVTRCVGLDRSQQVAERVRQLLRGIPSLAALPVPRLERLVREAHPMTVRVGQTVVRAGEAGREFYIVERGILEMVDAGHTHRPGDGFGDVALLRDLPQATTVRAVADSRLWAVSRPAFLAAISAAGSAAGSAAAPSGDALP